MKKDIFSLLLITVFSAVTAFSFAQDNGARITFEKESHNFGDISNGANGRCVFEFTNTGNAPLVISYAKSNCACVVATFSKEPVAPGAKGAITVSYDTKRVGPINKSVTITSNAANEPTKNLRIRGNVAPRAEGASPVINSGARTN